MPLPEQLAGPGFTPPPGQALGGGGPMPGAGAIDPRMREMILRALMQQKMQGAGGPMPGPMPGVGGMPPIMGQPPRQPTGVGPMQGFAQQYGRPR
jgi:hypothetical protein